MDIRKINQLLDLIKVGVDLDVACSVSELNYNLVLSWLEQGKIEEERLILNPDSEPHVDAKKYYLFYKSLKSAKASVIAAVQSSVFAAAKEDWRAAAWYLDKEMPQKYGSIQTQEALKQIEDRLKEIE